MKKNLLLSPVIVLFLLPPAISFAAENARSYEGVWRIAAQIEQRIQPPLFPDRDFVITAYGAGADDETDDSHAIGEAIAACHAAGGGRVVVPRGIFRTGPVHLKDNVNLHIAEGATVLFSNNPDDYLPQVFTRWEGVECMNYSPLIYAYGCRNIAITGKGTLDGQADNAHWWPWKGKTEFGWKEGDPNQLPARNRLIAMAEEGVPPEERVFGKGDYLRPSFIQPYRCENILIEGITLLRSPMWEIHPVLSRNVTVRGVTVTTHGPNNDGCNPESSRDVLIENCVFDTGDDCIAIKSGRNADGRRIGVPSENIIVRGCTMRDGHGGVVIGSEISGGCRNVFVEDCVMDSPNLDRAIRIKTNSIRGGLIDGVYVRNVEVGRVAESIFKVNFLYEEGDGYGFTPIVQNVLFENVNSRSSRFPMYIIGYERSPIRNVSFRNCRFEGVEEPSVIQHVENLVLDRVIIGKQKAMDTWGRMQ